MKPRWLLPLACSLILFAVGCGQFIRGAAPSEMGFDGAATVVEETHQGSIGIVTVKLPYLDVNGNTKLGKGRIMIRRADLFSGHPVPLFCHVHYEKDPGGAAHWCNRGWAVATAHYDAECPIDVSVGDGYNLARAVIEWARRLPFIDRTRVHIDGGSQGGYMALAMSADFFPLVATTADAPVVNWAYNLNYFEMNKPAMQWPQQDFKNSPLPILCSVTMLADWAYKVYGNDLRAESWYLMSPIAVLQYISDPVMVLCATGDMLVPMEQMTRTYLRPIDASRFPANYSRDFDTLTVCEPARKTFEECLPADSYAVNVVPLQEHSFELTLGMLTNQEKKPALRPASEQRPWSQDRQWSLCYMDEGGASPYGSHTSYEWNLSPDSFVDAHQKNPPAADTLTAAKLDRLLQRYEGHHKETLTLADGKPANRLNYPAIEQYDVLTALNDYANLGPDYAARLVSLYAAGERHPFGPALDLKSVAKERSGLLPAQPSAQEDNG